MQKAKKDLLASGLGQGEEGVPERVSTCPGSRLRKERYAQLQRGPPRTAGLQPLLLNLRRWKENWIHIKIAVGPRYRAENFLHLYKT